ncbi:MAG: homoserine dehydrogenase [Flavobacteriaceae bacterium]
MVQQLRLGVAGLGTVGASLVTLLAEGAKPIAKRAGREIVVTAVSARDRKRKRRCPLKGVAWHDDPVALANDPDVDVVVELIGGESGAAADAVRAALKAGKPVVTANKALLARHGVELARLAEANGVSIGFEAAVAGGIPVIKTMREALAGNAIGRVMGILNGTCNFILTKMEDEALDFQACLAEAQELGYAEADPTFDIGGFDSAHKLAILAGLAFGTEIDVEAIHLEGIETITAEDIRAAGELGYRIKLLGVARRTDSGIEQRVTPTMIPVSSAIANVNGVLNAVAIDGDAVGEIMLIGPGAGGDATASAVLSDIVDVARGQNLPTFGVPAATLKPFRRARMQKHEGGYYVRLAVYDRPGAFAAIAGRMAEEQISLESIVQKREHRQGGDDTPQPVVMITHDTTEAQIRRALEAIVADGHIAGRPQMIRIEHV